MRITTLTLILVMILTGCSYTTLRTTHRNATTGKTEVNTYSGFYEVLVKLTPKIHTNDVGMHIIAMMQRRKIPVLFGLQTAMGALPPSDLDAQAIFRCFFVNLKDTPATPITVFSIKHNNNELLRTPLLVQLQARELRTNDLASDIIQTYGTQETVNVVFALDGTTTNLALPLQRLTYDEINRRYSYELQNK